jgi:hypothetical protein
MKVMEYLSFLTVIAQKKFDAITFRTLDQPDTHLYHLDEVSPDFVYYLEQEMFSAKEVEFDQGIPNTKSMLSVIDITVNKLCYEALVH